MIHYVYVYTDVNTKRPVYVGRGVNTKGNFARANHTKNHASCRNIDVSVRIVAKNLSKENAVILESLLIEEYRKVFLIQNKIVSTLVKDLIVKTEVPRHQKEKDICMMFNKPTFVYRPKVSERTSLTCLRMWFKMWPKSKYKKHKQMELPFDLNLAWSLGNSFLLFSEGDFFYIPSDLKMGSFYQDVESES